MKKQIKLLLLAVGLVFSASTLNAVEKEMPAPVTTEESEIPLDQFELKLGYMTADELFVEADGWLKLLQEDAKKVYEKKIEIKLKNEKIGEVKELNASVSKIDDQKEAKEDMLGELTELRDIRREKEKKLNAILMEINERIGLDDKGQEQAKVMPYRRYLKSVSGV